MSKKYSAVCVLGAAAAKNFFDAADPIGKDLTIAGANFTVVGVYAQKDFMNQGYSLDNVIVIPYTSQRYLSEYSDLSDITVKVKDSASVNQVIALLNGNFDNWNQTGRGNFWCYSDQSWQDQSNQQALMMSLVLGAIAGISLLVGGIGIMNIMLVCNGANAGNWHPPGYRRRAQVDCDSVPDRSWRHLRYRRHHWNRHWLFRYGNCQ